MRKLKAVSLALLILGAGCTLPGSVPPVVKIGLVAPFEGLHRAEGYDALYAVKLAVREANASRELGKYRLELVALDDRNSPAEAIIAAGKISLDPDVVGVIGHLSEETTLAAFPIYARYHLPLVIPIPVLEKGKLGEGAFQVYPYPPQWPRILCSEGKILVFSCPGSAVYREISSSCPAENLDFYCYPEFPPTPQSYRVAFWPGDSSTGAEVLLKLRQNGFRGEFWGRPELCSSPFKALAGERGSWCFGGEREPEETFAQEYRKISGAEPGPFAWPAYVATKVLIKALKETSAEGRITRERVWHQFKTQALRGAD
ncbi:MAG: ABC transporter substrate-binding protein [Anaerolineae bacterium]|nr:ABC transporter substrate-binding protein [Anaerolineae bacterium]MDW8102936.1 ABC transporter substrate-binding protein [Anaerolineae bacterium]